MAALDLYSDLQLTDSRVRILTIDPGKPGERLGTTLRLGYLLHDSGALLLGDNHPIQYKALSYCWGPEGEPTMEFSCNGLSHCVGESAFQALLRLRHQWQPRNIWIDAICIDQKNYKEKAVQVPRMRDMYAKAQEVVVWLGQGDRQIRDLLERLAHTPSAGMMQQYRNMMAYGKEVKALISSRDTCPKTAEDLIKSMHCLTQLSWFTRVWTKQEIWAARKAVLRYDDARCEWHDFTIDTFERMVANFVQDVASVPVMGTTIQRLSELLKAHTIADTATLARVRDYDIANPYLSEDHQLDIVNVIRRCHGSHCGDKRDHVYGLMGMSSINRWSYDEDDKKREMLSVNYTADQSTSKTYEDLARYIMGRDDNLSLLFLEGVFDHQRPGEDFIKQPLPTWVPDWGRDYGSLNWLTSRVATPLSEKTLRLMQLGPPHTTAKRILSGVRFPLLVCGYRIGILNGETLSPEWSSPSNGLRHAEIIHMKTGFLSIADSLCEPLTERLLSELDPGFVQDGASNSDMVWAVPKRAKAGDVAIAVHGAYAPLLVRPSTDNIGQFTLVGPTVVPDDAYPYALDERAEAYLTQKRSSQFLRLCISGKNVTDRLREILQGISDKGERFEII